MKKILSFVLSICCFLTCFCFAGCDLKGIFSSKKENIYICGIVQTKEGDDTLYLSVPNADAPILFPEYDAEKIYDKYTKVYEKPLKSGDLVKIVFDEKDSVRMESTDNNALQYVTPVAYVYMYKEHVALEKNKNDWLLTVDAKDYAPKEGEIALGIGEYLVIRDFYVSNGWLGRDRVGDAWLVDIQDERMTFLLHLDGISVAKFLHNFATDSVTLDNDFPVLDFNFSLTWNTYGISSYDSQTGLLVKTKDVSEEKKADYQTTYFLTEEEKLQIYELIVDLDMQSYPDEYNPNPDEMSAPSQTLILSVQMGDFNKTITAQDIAIENTSKNEKGQKFLDVINEIANLLKATGAWKALPDYPYLYD